MTPSHANPLRLVFWETTAACNLECAHCRRLEVSCQPGVTDLSTEQGRKMIDDLAAFAQPVLVLSGGEPLLRPDVFDLSACATARGLPVALATNGTLVDGAIARQIATSGIRRVSISFDGANAETHDTFRRQVGAFDGALRGLRHIREAGVSTQINTTVTRHNVDQLDDLYALALGEKVDALHLFMLVPVGCGLEIADEQMLSAARYEETLHWLYDRSREGRIQTKATCAPHYFRVVRQRMAQEKREGADQPSPVAGHPGGHPGAGHPGGGHPGGGAMSAVTKGCLAGSGVCFVSHRGEVFPCGYLPVVCGDVTRQAFQDIWENSPDFQRLRNPDQLGGKCGRCEFRKVCEGCRARAYAATGDYMAEEPFCDYQPREMPDAGAAS